MVSAMKTCKPSHQAMTYVRIASVGKAFSHVLLSPVMLTVLILLSDLKNAVLCAMVGLNLLYNLTS